MASQVFDLVAELIADRTECEQDSITMESSFHDLELDSLETVEMLMELEEKLGKEFELDQKVETVGDLVAFIEKKMAE